MMKVVLMLLLMLLLLLLLMMIIRMFLFQRNHRFDRSHQAGSWRDRYRCTGRTATAATVLIVHQHGLRFR
uniref:Putative secreted protein n=1 Tax=Anopheles darlingi TaxID=43151 RepID=A0A2M4D2R7_ANODA